MASTTNPLRCCQYRSFHGRQCRRPESQRWRDGFCPLHSPQQRDFDNQVAQRRAETREKRFATIHNAEGEVAASVTGTTPADGSDMVAEAARRKVGMDRGDLKRPPPLTIEPPSPHARSLDSPMIGRITGGGGLRTPTLAYSRKDKDIEHTAEGITWKGSLSIVLDLDETLVAAQEGHPDMPLDKLDVKRLQITPTEHMFVALRPWAMRFLWHLKDQGFETYVLTAGSQDYCDAVVRLFNAKERLVLAGATCRDAAGVIQPKRFEQVLPADVAPQYAIAVDNRRGAWAAEYREQVIIIPEYLPEWRTDQAETVLMQVLDIILRVTFRFEQIYTREGRFEPIGDILALLYEDAEKQRMAEAVGSFQFKHPEKEREDESFISFLAAREGR